MCKTGLSSQYRTRWYIRGWSHRRYVWYRNLCSLLGQMAQVCPYFPFSVGIFLNPFFLVAMALMRLRYKLWSPWSYLIQGYCLKPSIRLRRPRASNWKLEKMSMWYSKRLPLQVGTRMGNSSSLSLRGRTYVLHFSLFFLLTGALKFTTPHYPSGGSNLCLLLCYALRHAILHMFSCFFFGSWWLLCLWCLNKPCNYRNICLANS